MDIGSAKDEVDTLINNARFRCHRPIRVAEILYHSRTEGGFDITDPEAYRVESGNWRDEMSVRLTGKGSSSSRSYQKDFSSLIDVEALATLDEVNRETGGAVESYIYRKLRKDKWNGLIEAQEYVGDSDTDEFSFDEYMNLTSESGLQEDAMLEIAVYALFSAVTSELDAKAKLELQNPDPDVLGDFGEFCENFLGLESGRTSFETGVHVHRAGQGTYAADKGVDIGSNFGTMVQVKHVSLTDDNARSIEKRAFVDRVVVVCREAERETIRKVADQIGFESVKAVVTIADLRDWYDLAFAAYEDSIGRRLLTNLRREFQKEFQSGDFKIPDVDGLLAERDYESASIGSVWRVE